MNAVLRTSQISERIRLGQGAEHPAFARRCCPRIQGEERHENGLDRGCFGSRFGHWLSQRHGWMRPGLPQHFRRRVRRRWLGQGARTERMSGNGLSPTSVRRRICLAATYARVLPGLTRSQRRLDNTRWLRVQGGKFHGERGGTRTLDPMIKSHVLYRLSYALTCRAV